MNDANPHLQPKILAIGGPTAIGKTRVGIALAQALNAEIVSADSVQLYRGFVIGAATPNEEEQQGIPHHLISCLDPDEPISAADFARRADRAISDILQRKKLPILVGGSGLYLRALLYGLIEAPPRDDQLRHTLEQFADTLGDRALWERLKTADPRSAEVLHPHDRVRVIRALEVFELTGQSIRESQEKHRFQKPRYQIAGIGLTAQRSYLHARINLRTEQMFEQGLIDEVQELLRRGVPPSGQPFTSIGYKDVLQHLQNHPDPLHPDAIERLKKDVATHTRRFARRQLVWFRKEPSFRWINAEQLDDNIPRILDAVRAFLRGEPWETFFESERDASGSNDPRVRIPRPTP